MHQGGSRAPDIAEGLVYDQLLKSRICVVGLSLMAATDRVGALEILHIVEARDYVRVMEDATGVKMGDDGSACASITPSMTMP